MTPASIDRQIDLRSDLHARPTEEMWEAMRAAPLGWATYGEDPSVNELQERVAGLLGKEAALWVPTCAMANLVALLTIAPRGSTVVLEASSHVLTSEAMGIEEIAGLEPRSLWAADGRLDPVEVEELIVETGATMLVLENTHTRAGGTVLTPELTAALAGAAQRHGAYVHLDGARLFNAAVALGVPVRELAAPVNTVAVSLNKGLCAPMGTILAGRTQVIELAHRTLGRLGGASVHKAGIAAAAALVALDTLVERLADDHRRARELGALLQEVPGLEVEPAEIETNIVLVDVSGTELYPDEFLRLLAERGVLGLERDTSRVRFVTHRLIGDADVASAAEFVNEVVAASAA
ncbi:MAG: aminotransferase class I/II-fold pyridoxal phosphate-dependent enzyme [Actinobacteria bacterium]|nr:aminotransferase class I/II-fold pyridoxal phosphate-dependent enzyme [Actinomycetota bacterium]